MTGLIIDPVADTILTDGLWDETFDEVQDEDDTPDPIPPGTVILVTLLLLPAAGQAAGAAREFSSEGPEVAITDGPGGQWQMNVDPTDFTPGRHALEVRKLYPGMTVPVAAYRGVRNVIAGAST